MFLTLRGSSLRFYKKINFFLLIILLQTFFLYNFFFQNHLKHRKNRFQGGIQNLGGGGEGPVWRRGRLTLIFFFFIFKSRIFFCTQKTNYIYIFFLNHLKYRKNRLQGPGGPNLWRGVEGGGLYGVLGIGPE